MCVFGCLGGCGWMLLLEDELGLPGCRCWKRLGALALVL